MEPKAAFWKENEQISSQTDQQREDTNYQRGERKGGGPPQI